MPNGMCAQYIIKENIRKLQEQLKIPLEIDGVTYPMRILPHTMAPVITPDQKIKPMNFSLIPVWSKERKPKFATHNARLESIAVKPTWKRPFLHNHCVVPMTSFVEPIYTGEFAGNMVSFNSDVPLVAAGISDNWTDRSSGESIDSFAVVTSDPSDFVNTTGHDRQPVFIDPKLMDLWLNTDSKDPDYMMDMLLSIAITPTFTVSVDRPMAKGWEKRIPKD